MPVLHGFRQTARCLRDNFQGTGDGVYRFSILGELIKKLRPLMNTCVASMLSRISRRRCAGFLEGIDGVAQDGVAKQRTKRLAVYDVRGASQKLSDIDLAAGIFKDADRLGGIEVDLDVDIACRRSFASSN